MEGWGGEALFFPLTKLTKRQGGSFGQSVSTTFVADFAIVDCHANRKVLVLASKYGAWASTMGGRKDDLRTQTYFRSSLLFGWRKVTTWNTSAFAGYKKNKVN